MKYIIISCITCLLGLSLTAQPPQFVTKGKIEFERKYNMHKQFEDDGEWTEQIKKMIPQFNVTYFDMMFDGNRVAYKPGRDNSDANKTAMWGSMPASENTVITDLNTQQYAASKQVFEQSFLVQDSLAKFNWKITSEMRKIAGFNCRRAETIIMDSVYVVAFYTDEIPVSGGPESFNGLPGMILGLAMPRIHLTIFATKLELIDPKENDFKPLTKGKKVTTKGLKTSLAESLKSWGKYAQRYLWLTSL
ncbi:MAG: GLPGLI family protein [Chitinophagaceae bacterium]